MNPRSFVFTGGDEGSWRVIGQTTVTGEGLAEVKCVGVIPAGELTQRSSWILRGTRSNERYSTSDEKLGLTAIQPQLGRIEATCAVMIPIRKSDAWWDLPQDERRRIFEDRSAHIAIGTKYLPAIARRLYHCRDLETPEPFDFITWFEFAPGDSGAFDELLAALRGTIEWSFIDREVEVRMTKADC